MAKREQTAGEKVRRAAAEVAASGGVQDVFGRVQTVAHVNLERPCQHSFGFLFARRCSIDGVNQGDLYYCPACQARRLMDDAGRVMATAEGGVWQ